MLAMLLEPGSIEMGWRRSELARFAYSAGEIILSRRHVETWARSDGLYYLSISISDAALRAASNGISSDIQLRNAPKLEDARASALVAAVNAERLAGVPSGQLFLDAVEQGLAVVLVNNHAVRHRSVRTYGGGLGPVRLRRVTQLVHAKIENELSLAEMAATAGLSTAHFSQLFRKSTGESLTKSNCSSLAINKGRCSRRLARYATVLVPRSTRCSRTACAVRRFSAA